MKGKSIRPLATAIGASLLATTLAHAAGNPFTATELQAGYQLAADDKPAEGKCGDAKPAEGKCGDAKPAEGKCGDAKPAEGKCGEGKCGEGKCGDKKTES